MVARAMTTDKQDLPEEEGLSADQLDGIPADMARRLLRAFNRSPSTWVSLIDSSLTTRFIGRSASWLQGTDSSGRVGKKSLERLHPDDVGPLLHALDQLRAATPESTPTVPVVEPLRYRIRRLDRPDSWMTVEALVLNMLSDPVTDGLVLLSRPAGGGLDPIGTVLDLLVEDAPLPQVLAACTELIPSYLGSAAVVALLDDGDALVAAPPGSAASRLCTDDRWWRKALSEGEDHAPVDFQGYPPDLADKARAEGFHSAWVIPLRDSSTKEVIGGIVVWVRITVEYNIATDDGLRKTARLARLVIGEQRTHAALRREAVTDPLTGIANRSALRRRLDAATGEVTLSMVDLDEFKPINDTYGHDTGDGVLQVVAERLRSAVREDDLVARLGGDEFAVVFADGSAPVGIEQSEQRILHAISEPIQLGPLRLQVGASIGTATGPPGEVLHRADATLYQQKRQKAARRRE